MFNFRIGSGIDIHRLEPGRDFWLGGIQIPHEKGALGHSDADVLIHAICDALLGAAGLGDIGRHFPDTSPEFKGIDSKILLKRVVNLLSERNIKIINIDSTVCLEKPKIAAFIPDMRNTLSAVLNIDVDCISVKATTTEKLGYEGREEGISAYAVALIVKL